MPHLGLVLVWLAAILGAYLVLFWLAPRWARRTADDVDDVVVGVLQKPLLFIICLWAVINLAGHADLAVSLRAAIQRAANLSLIAAITWTVWRLVRDTVLYYGRSLARRTEANFDDVLFPVLEVLAPVVILGTGAILMLRLLGADIGTVVLTTAGSAVIVALALGDMIKNVLGGLILLIDTPFRFGDLIIWDGVVCQIRRIGLRVTTLYNTEDHSEIFLPNSLLAASKLTNITRPSPDLRMSIDLSLADAARIPQARAALLELADSNPYVLGDVSRKLEAMKRALTALDPASDRARELQWGIIALRHEQQLDRQLAEVSRILQNLLATIRQAERGGLTAAETAAISAQLDTLEACDDRLQAAIRLWARARAIDPQLQRYPHDGQRLLSEADSHLLAYQHRLAELRRHLKNPGLFQAQRLDDLVAELQEWLPRNFKLITPAWKHPFMATTGAGAHGAALRLYVYVDDIHLERFVRRQRVITALREDAAALLRAIDSPPQGS